MASHRPGLYHPVRVGTVELPGNVWGAPMAGYTDAPFRTMLMRHGAAFCWTEMVSAVALAHDDAGTLRLLRRAPGENAVGFQIFAPDPHSAAEAARKIAPLRPAIIDLNCGCSVPKVLKTGCGAALMRSPATVAKIVAAMRAEVDVPVAVKLRSGWDAATPTFLACAAEAVRAGAALVTLHPRHRAQGFAGTARWELIAELKEACPVPVAGSGDLFTAEDCRAMLERTGCDAVMVARGCIGNPFIFEQARALLEGREPPARSAGEKLAAALDHLDLLAADVGEPKACRDMRKHFVAYTKGLEGGARLREQLVHASSREEYRRLVEEWLGAH